MRAVKRWRYFCDFCKRKSGGSKFHMLRHERGCTMNPHRVCSIHVHATGAPEHPTMPELGAALADGGYAALRQLCDNCPACTLAALRQFDPFDPSDIGTRERPDGRDSFDFKRELAEMWEEVNNHAVELY